MVFRRGDNIICFKAMDGIPFWETKVELGKKKTILNKF